MNESVSPSIRRGYAVILSLSTMPHPVLAEFMNQIARAVRIRHEVVVGDSDSDAGVIEATEVYLTLLDLCLRKIETSLTTHAYTSHEVHDTLSDLKVACQEAKFHVQRDLAKRRSARSQWAKLRDTLCNVWQYKWNLWRELRKWYEGTGTKHEFEMRCLAKLPAMQLQRCRARPCQRGSLYKRYKEVLQAVKCGHPRHEELLRECPSGWIAGCDCLQQRRRRELPVSVELRRLCTELDVEFVAKYMMRFE